MPRPTRLLEEIVFTGKLGAKVTESMAERATQAASAKGRQQTIKWGGLLDFVGLATRAGGMRTCGEAIETAFTATRSVLNGSFPHPNWTGPAAQRPASARRGDRHQGVRRLHGAGRGRRSPNNEPGGVGRVLAVCWPCAGCVLATRGLGADGVRWLRAHAC